MADHELGLQNAIRQTWGVNVRIAGCLWHYVIRIHEAVHRYNLTPLFEENRDILRPLLRRLCTLPRLPATRFNPDVPCSIMDGYNAIWADLLHRRPDLHALLQPLRTYWEDQWQRRVGVDVLSVYGKYHSTTNNVETHHLHFRRDLLQADLAPVCTTWDINGE